MEMPSVDAWLDEAKREARAGQCGMYLIHNGVVRATPKAQVRNGVQGLPCVAQLEFGYDSAKLDELLDEARSLPGVFYVRAWLNDGVLGVGDPLMLVLVGADIRPRCIAALDHLVARIKNEAVIEREVPA